MKEPEFYQQSPFGRWLLDEKETILSFSRKSFISPPTIYKAVRGLPLRCSTIKQILYFARKLSEDDFKKVDYSYLTVEPKSDLI